MGLIWRRSFGLVGGYINASFNVLSARFFYVVMVV